MTHPTIIQGGMGIAVSNRRLARAVSREGALGVVSGTLLAVVLARRLASGDPSGDLRWALGKLPLPGLADRILARYFVPGGLPADRPFPIVPRPTLEPNPLLDELTVAANFTEVFLAKEGHDGPIGLNLLEKIQLPTLASLFGAMLAGVDYVLMGAGIPRAIPRVLDRLATGEPVDLKINVEAPPGTAPHVCQLDPTRLGWPAGAKLKRPHFLAIVSSAALALTLAKKAEGHVDGFVIESPIAGGHNAPPRGPQRLSPTGEPIYGPRDHPDLAEFRALGRPFWLAGGQATPAGLAAAQAAGAVGLQVGSLFALCAESGLAKELKSDVLRSARAGGLDVFTDPRASPTGFPFKVARVPGTLADPACYATRRRVCDLGYLREAVEGPDGRLVYRCPAEPVADFTRKGGDADATEGRMCLCNGLLSAVGRAQSRRGEAEPAVVTIGGDCQAAARLATDGGAPYRARDVLRYLHGAPDNEATPTVAPQQAGAAEVTVPVG